MRKAASAGKLTLDISQYRDTDGKTHLQEKQFFSVGIPAGLEHHVLDWEYKTIGGMLGGKVRSRLGWAKADQLGDEGAGFLRERLLLGPDGSDECIREHTTHETGGWSAHQVSSLHPTSGVCLLQPPVETCRAVSVVEGGADATIVD